MTLTSNSGKLVIAISSSALFDLTDSDAVFNNRGLKAYSKYQIENENKILERGEAFNLTKKLLEINQIKKEKLVEVILLSRNSADTGLRVFNSINHYNLDITRAAFSGGSSPYKYIADFSCDLFLSRNSLDVRNALDNGIAAATLLASNNKKSSNNEIRIAFDGDSVLFSDSSEKIFKSDGLEAFCENETRTAQVPLDAGPFKSFLLSLQTLQTKFSYKKCPIRTALVTARSAPAHERVIRTLRSWDVRIDESLFLGGLEKGDFLESFGADLFFDDQQEHCASASKFVTTGHVPHGVSNV
tara:strand:+ start:914 stop:1813 length:900 start_codon:yes stop_codon:yes gene_type:complete